ncbi:MAG: hypothetical protein WAN75_06075, partial [Xanthobacteraceae bacterium]
MPLGPVFVLGCRLGDDLFLVVDDLDRLLEQPIGAQLDGNLVFLAELRFVAAPAMHRAARWHGRLAGYFQQRLAVRDAVAHQVSDRGAEDVVGVRRRRVGQDLDPVGPCLAHGLCVVLTEEAVCQLRRCCYRPDVVFLAAHRHPIFRLLELPTRERLSIRLHAEDKALFRAAIQVGASTLSMT